MSEGGGAASAAGFRSEFEETLRTLGLSETSELERTDVKISNEDKQAAKKFEDIEKDRLEQAHALRPVFFWLAAALAGIAVATSAAMVLGVVFWNRTISDGLGIAFITSLSIETLGILALVGRYLFTQPSDPPPASEEADGD